jgi:hypothetical protein
MKSSKDTFRKSIDKAAVGVELTPEVVMTLSKLKNSMKENETLKGGLADKKSLQDLARKHKLKDTSELERQLKIGMKVELEHTDDKKKAKEIAMDHIFEDPKYYDKLSKIESKEATGSGSSGAYSGPVFGGDNEFWERSKSETPKPKKIETKEATTSGSVGAYETPAAWAKSTGKKDWRGKSKTQIPGGAFVSVKKKCTKFPYCNKGDISALNIYQNENVNNAISNISKKLNLSETTIKAILQYEMEKLNKQTK